MALALPKMYLQTGYGKHILTPTSNFFFYCGGLRCVEFMFSFTCNQEKPDWYIISFFASSNQFAKNVTCICYPHFTAKILLHMMLIPSPLYWNCLYFFFTKNTLIDTYWHHLKMLSSNYFMDCSSSDFITGSFLNIMIFSLR